VAWGWALMFSACEVESGMRRDIATLRIEPAGGELPAGNAVQLNLFSASAGGVTDLVPANMARWLSSNPSVAEVSRQGRLSPRRPGTVSITATASGQTARADFTVIPQLAP
jgi:hypothetical protein